MVAARGVTAPAAAAPDLLPKVTKPLAVARVDSAAWEADVRLLSGYDPLEWQGVETRILSRYARSEGITVAGGWLCDQLRAIGYAARLDTFLYAFNRDTILCRNVVAQVIGDERPKQVVVLGAHYDSYASGVDASILAPGAEDNATGVAAVLEAARALAGQRFACTVQFVFFSAEELGLWGSQHHVERLAAAGDTVKAAVIADMVSYWQDEPAIMLDALAEAAWLAQLVVDNLRTFTSLADSTRLTAASLIKSDHVPFAATGAPAVLLIDRDWESYSAYHSIQDTWSAISAKTIQGVAAARVAVATIADLAGMRATELPVLITELRARTLGAAVELTWRGETLPVGAGLAVWRAAGGSWQALTPVLLVPPPGPTSWRDTTPSPADIWRFYRLDLVAADGRVFTVAGPISAPAPDDFPAPAVFVRRASLRDAAVATLFCAAARPGQADLSLYDLAGRTVRVLWRGWLPSEGLALAWDGRDAAGRPVATGLYLVRLTTEGGAATARVPVIR